MRTGRNIFIIGLNPLGSLPLMRYIIPLFHKEKPFIFTTYVKGSYVFDQYGTQENMHVFDTAHELNNHPRTIDIRRYYKITRYLVKVFTRYKTGILYTVDFQVIALALLLGKVFHNKVKLIYHQFEIFDPEMVKGLANRLQLYVLRHAMEIDLTIFPEKNRQRYFYQYFPDQTPNSVLIPNTNDLMDFPGRERKIIPGIPDDHIVIGHIGNMGAVHHTFAYFDFIRENTNPNLSFLFIGRIENKVWTVLRKLAEDDKRVVIIKEVSHPELIQYYSRIDIGVILYKGVDKNNEYCAPNKLYEYWSQGIPVVAHKLKGLQDIWRHRFMGELIDFNNRDQIEEGVSTLIRNLPGDKSALQSWFRKEAAIGHYIPVLMDKMEVL